MSQRAGARLPVFHTCVSIAHQVGSPKRSGLSSSAQPYLREAYYSPSHARGRESTEVKSWHRLSWDSAHPTVLSSAHRRISGAIMGSGTNAILICGSQMDVSTPTKRCSPLRAHLSKKTSPQIGGKRAM